MYENAVEQDKLALPDAADCWINSSLIVKSIKKLIKTFSMRKAMYRIKCKLTIVCSLHTIFFSE